MSKNVIQFPIRPRALTVPTTDRIVRVWAEMAARKIAFSMNPNPHNKDAYDAAMKRYSAECDKAGWPA